MLKNLRRKNQAKDKISSDLFKYSTICEHGFLHQPSAIAYNPNLHLLAIGTRNGRIKIFGKPGVEIQVQDSCFTAAIQQLVFLENEGHIVSVCNAGDQNSLHLWEINFPNLHESTMVEVKSCILEGRLKKISICHLSKTSDCLYIGTEGGHIYTLDLISFELKDQVIYQDIVMKSLPSDVMSNTGSVEDIQEHPTEHEKILIGYKKGLIVLWNQDKIKIECFFVSSQCVESVYWHYNCNGFISAHENGSLSLWNLSDADGVGGIVQEQSTPFGPFPCKAILKVEWYDPLIIFSGGLPRASYSDKHSISIMEDNAVQTVLEFTSKVIDYVLIKEPSELVPSTLMVLCEEEIVVIDLQAPGKSFSTYLKPYLACIHSSNISTSAHVYDCPVELWNILKVAGEDQLVSDLSTKDWPVNGGDPHFDNGSRKDIVITGHEDGSVKFWDASSLSFNLLCAIYTAKLFIEYDGYPPPDDGEDDWPPFKKVGNFDPFMDDSRFVIQKISLCPLTKTLIVGGSGGQLIIYNLSGGPSEGEKPEVLGVNVIENLVGFEWKGLGPLTLVSDDYHNSKFIPVKVLQIKPSAPITAIAMEMAKGLIAFGTCHGFALYDNISHNIVVVKCTVNPTDLANTGAGIQRKRTITKSLRDSFRRLRSRRKSKKQKTDDLTQKRRLDSFPDETSPQTRLIDENRVDEEVLSMVRCLYFGETYLGDASNYTLTLWAGTNAGYIYVYSINIPDNLDRTGNAIKTEVGKELKLKHHAPVVSVVIIDKDGIPIGSINDRKVGCTNTPDTTGGHSLLILSEEQLKIFSLPTLRPRNKVKLTAIDGSRLRKMGMLEVHAKDDGDVSVTQHCLVCLTNQGDIIVYSIPFLKQQFKVNVSKREDIRAISSLLFTHLGEIFFMKSPSEMQRVNLLSNNTLESKSTTCDKRNNPIEDTEQNIEKLVV